LNSSQLRTRFEQYFNKQCAKKKQPSGVFSMLAGIEIDVVDELKISALTI
jgi:hypothetical protein